MVLRKLISNANEKDKSKNEQACVFKHELWH